MARTSQPSITARLFEAAHQCPKRLHLMAAEEEPPPDAAPDEDRAAMIAVGEDVRALARTAFPSGRTVARPDTVEGAEETAAWLRAGQEVALFDATFEHNGLRVVCDIILRAPDGSIDLFEIKAGNSIKPRYLHHMALQVHAIEGLGHTVGRCEILHMDPRYRFDGAPTHPIPKLFRNVDVSRRVRQRCAGTESALERVRALLADPVAAEHPTGSWCEHPFPCPYLPACRQGEPETPLRHLPDLTAERQRQFHSKGLHDLRDMDPAAPEYSPRQGLAIRAARSGTVQIAPWVTAELADLEYPIHCLAILYALDVIPTLEGARPWQFVPYAWSVHTLHANDQTEQQCWVAPPREDPRVGFARRLRDRTDGPGALVLYSQHHARRLRQLMDALDDGKRDLRAVLHSPWLALDHLVENGVAHPTLGGREFRGLKAVARALGVDTSERSNPSETALTNAWRKATAPRTRPTTRSRSVAELEAEVNARSAATLGIFRRLRASD